MDKKKGQTNMKKLVYIVAVILSLRFGCKENPVDVKPENHNPVIFSLTVFPDVISPTDSAIVICNAMDPDGDTLVYDWITDSRLKIKGDFANEDWLYHTRENSRVVYPKNLNNVPFDTLWIQCNVRDVKGGEVGKLALFVLQQK
jgi:hypothetical protein